MKKSWIRFVPVFILAQTLFFKFTGSEESIWIFSKLGVEPWGRFLIAILELVAVILLVIPRTLGLGAILTIGLMFGAILSHIFVLGVVVQNDSGLLFGLGVLALLVSAFVFWKEEGVSKIKLLFVSK